jgi:hypothetical protein
MSIEKTLAAIPTDQLVFKFLQELAARVEKLEKKHEAEDAPNPSATASQLGDSPENPIVETDQPHEERSQPEQGPDEESRCLTCRKLPGDGCQCVEIPYGHLIDFDQALPELMMSITSMEDRIHAMEFRDPARLVRIKKLSIAGVPPDGRLTLKNFWDRSSDLEEAIEALDEIHWIQGFFRITDIGADGTSFDYGFGDQSIAGRVRGMDGEPVGRVQIPLFRFDPENVDCGLAHWNRLM